MNKEKRKQLEKMVMIFSTDIYLRRVVRAMYGMKFRKAEKCRLNYWDRVLKKIKKSGLYPSWEDFQSYLKMLPNGIYPKISQIEFESIIAEGKFTKIINLQQQDIRMLIVEQCFLDYVSQINEDLKYLPSSKKAFRVKSFWHVAVVLCVLDGLKFNACFHDTIVKKFNLPKSLRLHPDQITEVHRGVHLFIHQLNELTNLK